MANEQKTPTTPLYKTSDAGKTFIKNNEGFSLNAYPDSKGYSIGWGHYGVDKNAKITEDQAVKYFDEDITKVENFLNSFGLGVSQSQFDALADFVYNVGPTKAASSTLFQKVVTNPNDAAIKDEFAKWKYSTDSVTGKKIVNDGLISRRSKEAEFYFGEPYTGEIMGEIPLGSSRLRKEPIEPPAQGKARFDFERGLMSGLDPVDITAISRNLGVEVKPPSETIEEFRQKYPDIPEGEAQKMFETINENYKYFQDGEFSAASSKYNWFPATEFYDVVAPGMNTRPEIKPVKGFYGDPTKLPMPGNIPDIQYTTDQLFARSVPIGMTKEGTWIPIDDLLKNGTYVQVEIGDPSKNEPPLYYRELKDGEFGSAERMRTILGDQELFSSVGSSIVRGLWAGGAPLIAKGTGSFVGVIGDLTAMVLNDNRASLLTKEFEREMQNWGNYHTHKNLDERMAAFDNWNSAMWNIGNGVSQMGSMMAAGYITGTANIAMGVGVQMSRRLALESALWLGSVEGGAGFRESMREMGVPDDVSAMYFFPFAMATYASERLMNRNLIESFGGDLAIRKYLGMTKMELMETVNKAAGRSVVNEVSGLAAKTQMNIAQRAWRGIANTNFKLTKVAESNKWARIGVASFDEATEEITEGMMHAGISYIANGLNQTKAKVIEENFDGIRFDPNIETMKQDPETGVMYNPTPWKMTDTKNGGSKNITQSQYEDYQEMIAFKDGIKDGTIKLDTTVMKWDEAALAGISTFIAFGMGSAFSKNQNKAKKNTTLELAIAEYVNPKLEAENERIGAAWIKSGALGPNHEPIDPTDPKSPSKAQATWNSFRDEVKYWKTLIQVHKLDSREFKHATNGDPGLLKEALRRADVVEQINGYIQQSKAAEQGQTIPLPEALQGAKTDADIQTRLQEAVAELNEHIKPKNLAYTFNGQPKTARYTEAFSDRLRKTMAVDAYMRTVAEVEAIRETKLDPTDPKYDSEIKRITQVNLNNLYKHTGQQSWEEYSKDVNQSIPNFNKTSPNSIISKFNVNLQAIVKETEDMIAKIPELTDIETGDRLTALTDNIGKAFAGFDISNIPAMDDVANIFGTTHNDLVGSIIRELKQIAADAPWASSFDRNAYTVRLGGIKAKLAAAASNIIGLNDPPQSYVDLMNTIDESLKGSFSQVSRVTTIREEMKVRAFMKTLGELPVVGNRATQQTLGTLREIFDRYTTLMKDPNSDIDNGIEVEEQFKEIINTIENYYMYDLMNYDFYQQTLESKENLKEHSLLINDPVSSFSLQTYREIKRLLIGQIAEAKKVAEWAHSKGNNIQLRKARIRMADVDVNVAAMNYIHIRFPDVVIEPFLNRINVALKKPVEPNSNEEIGSIVKLYELIAEKMEANQPVNYYEDIAREIEAEIVDWKDSMTGKLDKQIEDFKTGYNPGYFQLNDFENRPVLDSNSRTLSGLFTGKAFEVGIHQYEAAVANKGNSSKREEEMVFVWFMLTEMNRINLAGRNNTPGYKATYAAMRSVLKDKEKELEGGMEYMPFSDQEVLIKHMLLFAENPDASKIWRGRPDPTAYAHNFLNIRGYGGVGKTRVISKIFLQSYLRLHPDKNTVKVKIVIPGPDLAKVWLEVLGTVGGRIEVQFEYVDNVNQDNEPADLVFIDESSIIPTGAITEIIAQYGNNEIPVMTFGDDFQTNEFLRDDGTGKYPYAQEFSKMPKVGERTMPAINVWRTQQIGFYTAITGTRNAIHDKTQDKDFFGKWKLKNGNSTERIGLQYFNTSAKVLKEFLDYVNSHNGAVDPDQAILIVATTEEKEELIARENLEKHRDNIKTLEYDWSGIKAANEAGKKSIRKNIVSGIQSQNVYFYSDLATVTLPGQTNRIFNKTDNASRIQYLRAKLTGMSRVQTYLAMVGDEANQEMVPQNAEDTEIAGYLENRSKIIGATSVRAWQEEIGDVDDQGNRTGRLYKIIRGVEDVVKTQVAQDEEQQDLDITNPLSDAAHDDVVAQTKKKRAEITRKAPVPDGALHVTAIIGEKYGVVKTPVTNETEEQKAFHAAENKMFHAAMRHIMINTAETLNTFETVFNDYIPMYEKQYNITINDPVAFKISVIQSIVLNEKLHNIVFNDLSVLDPQLKFKNPKDPDDKTVYGQPMVVEVIGYNTVKPKGKGKKEIIVPIVNIHDVRFVHGDVEFSDYSKAKLAAYMVMLTNQGFIVNDARIHHVRVDIANKTIDNYATYVLNEEDKTTFGQSVAGDLFGDQKFFNEESSYASEEDILANERIIHIEAIPINSIITQGQGQTAVAYRIDQFTQDKNDRYVYATNLTSGEKSRISWAQFHDFDVVNPYDGRSIRMHKRGALLFSEEKGYATSNIFVQPAGFSLTYPETEYFYDINNNNLLKAKQLVANQLGNHIGTRLKRVLGTGMVGMQIDSRTGKIKNSKYPLTNAILLELEDEEAIVDIIESSEDLKDILSKGSWYKRGKGIAKPTTKTLVAEFKKNGLQYIAVEPEVEYDYGNYYGDALKLNAVKDPEIQKKVDQYYNQKGLLPEQQEALLDEIFANAFTRSINGKNEQDILEENGLNWSPKDEEAMKPLNIALNKHAMRSRRALILNEEIEHVGTHVELWGLDGGTKLVNPIDNNGKRQKKSLKQLVNDFERNGLVVSKDEDGNVIIHEAPVQKGTKYFIEVKRPGSAYSEKVPVNGRVATTQDIQDMVESLSLVTAGEFDKLINELETEYVKTNKDSTYIKSLARRAFALMRSTEAMNFVRNNEKQILELASNNRNGIWSSYVYYDESFREMKPIGDTVMQRMTSLQNFMKALIQNGTDLEKAGVKLYLTPYGKKANNEATWAYDNIESNYSNITQHGVLFTQDIPNYDATQGVAVSQNVTDEEDDGIGRSSDSDAGFDRVVPEVQSIEELDWRTADLVRAEIRRLVGTVADSHTFIKPDLLAKGKLGRVIQVLDGHFNILMGERNGKLEFQTARHESMHYIMFTLVNEDQRFKLLEQARQIMKSKGLTDLSRKNVHEFIADMFMDRDYVNYQPTGLLQRFFRWLADVLGIWVSYRSDLINLMYAAEGGRFVNANTFNNNIDFEADKVIKETYTDPEIVKQAYEIFYEDQAQILKIARDVVGLRIREHSPYGKSFNRNLDMHQTLKLAYNEFNNESRKVADIERMLVFTINGVKQEPVKVKISEMTPGQYKQAIQNAVDNKKIIRDYRLFHIGHENKVVFGVLAKKLFPSLHVENELKGKQSNKTGKFVRSSANEESDRTELLSPWLDLIMRGIPFRSAITNRSKGETVDGDQAHAISGMNVPYGELDSMLNRAMQNVVLKNGINNVTIKKWFAEIERMMDHAPTGKYKNILWSFLMEFGPIPQHAYELFKSNLEKQEGDIKDRMFREGKGQLFERSSEHSRGYINWSGYYALLYDQRLYKNKMLAGVRATIDDKRQFWEEAVKAVFRVYLSNVPRERANAQFSEKVEIKRKTSLDVDMTKASILDNARGSSIGSNNFVKRHIKDAFMPEEGEGKYKITAAGIKTKDGALIIDPKNFSLTTPAQAWELFRALGFYDVDKKTLEHLYPLSTLRDNKAGNADEWSVMVQHLFYMLQATKLNIMLEPVYNRLTDEYDAVKQKEEDFFNRIQEEDKALEAAGKPIQTDDEVEAKISKELKWTVNPIKLGAATLEQAKFVYKFYTDNGLEFTKVETIQSEKYIDQNYIDMNLQENTIYPSAIDFWTLFQDYIAPAKVEIKADEAGRITMAVDGTFEYQYPLSANFYDRWRPGVGYPKTKSAKERVTSDSVLIMRDFKKKIDEKNYKNNSPLVVVENGKMIVYNPLLNGKIAIDAVDVWGGIDGTYKGIKHDHTIPYDLFRVMFEGFFKSYMMKPGNRVMGAFHDTVADKPTIPSLGWMSLDNDGKPSIEARLIHVQRKGIFLGDVSTDSFVLTNILQDFIGYYTNVQKLAKNNWKKVKGKTLEQIEKMDDIEVDRDYVIGPNNVLLEGKASLMENNPYLSNALAGWEKATAAERHKMIRKAFNEQFKQFVAAVEDSGYVMYEIAQNKIKWDHKKKDAEGKPTDAIDYVVEVDGEPVWHPVFEAVFWSHHIINEAMAHLTRGNAWDYSDITDYIKRAAGLFAPGESYVVDPEMSYLGETARVQVFDDFYQKNPTFGPGKVRISDGYSILNAVTHEMMRRDTGRYLGNVYGGALKNVNFDYNPVTHTRTYLKFAQFPITATLYKNDRFHREAQKAMIGEKLGNFKAISTDNTNRTYKAGGLDTFFEKLDNNFEEGIRDLVDFLKSEMGQEYRKELVDYAVFRSGFKSGAKKIHQFKTKDGGLATSFDDAVYPTDINGDEHIVGISNRTMRLQTITYQDVIDPEKAIPTQLLYILGALPNNNSVVTPINQALGQKVIEHSTLIRELNMAFGDRKAYLKHIALARLSERQLGGKIIALMGNMEIHPDILRDKHVQNFVSEVNDYLKPTMPGQNFIQAPSTIDIYIRKLTVLGSVIEQPYLFEDAIKTVPEDQIPEAGFQTGDDLPGFTKRKINPRGYKSKSGKSTSKENIIADPTDYEFIPEEIVTAFPYIDKFGLYADDPAGNATTKPLTLVDAFTVIDTVNDAEGKFVRYDSINFYGFNEEQIVKALISLEGNIGDAFLSMKSSQREKVLPGVKTKKDFQKWQEKGRPQELAVRIAEYYANLYQAMESFIVRIPTTNASSASSSRIVAFTYDAANTIFVSPLKNLLDGTDFDIDAIQAYFRPQTRTKLVKDKRTGELKEKQIMDEMQKTIFDSILMYYQDTLNAPMILEQIDISSFEKRAAESNKKFAVSASNPGGMVDSTAINMAGKNLVGHYANLMNFMMRLFAHYASFQAGKMNGTVSGLENIKILEGTPEEIRERIIKTVNLVAKFINAATDNAKLGGLLGRLNVNEATTAVIHGMILSGLTEEQIFDELLNNEDLIKASKETISSKKANNMYPNRIASHLKDPILKKYANIGEQLRRLGDIVQIQQGIKADSAEFYRSVRNVEIALGMTMGDFLDRVKADAVDTENQTHLSSVPFDSYKSTVYFANAKSKKLDEENEIRKSFDIRRLVANQPNLLSYVEMLNDSRDFFRGTFTVDAKKFDEVRAELMRITRSDLGWTETLEGVEKGIEDYMVGRFITDNFKQVNLYFRGAAGEAIVAHRRFDQFNLSKMTDRVRFTLLFPSFVQKLKEQFENNEFVRRLTIETRRDNFEQQVVEFSNSIYVDDYQKLFFHREFSKLPEDVKNTFRAYSLLVYGFAIRNGSFTEFLDTENEKAYSEWTKTFNYKKVNAKEIAFGIALKNPTILRKFKPNEKYENINRRTKDPMLNLVEDRHLTPVVAARIFSTGEYETEDIFKLWSQANYGDEAAMKKAIADSLEFYAPINDPYPSWINTYSHHIASTTFKPFHTISIQDHFDLMLHGKVKVLGTKLERIASLPPADWSIRTKQKQRLYEAKYLTSENYVTLPDGNVAIVHKLGYNEVELELLKPTEKRLPKSKEELKNTRESDRLSREEATASRDFLDVVMWKLKQAFPGIQFRMTDSQDPANLFPTDFAYVKNGEVWINTDLARRSSPFHEYGHIIEEVIRIVKPDLFQKIKAQAREVYLSDTSLRAMIDEHYGDLNEDEKLREVIATMIGWNSAKDVEKYFARWRSDYLATKTKSKTLWEKIKDLIKSIRDSFNRIFSKNFGLTKTLQASDLSLEEISSTLVSLIDQGLVVTSISSNDYGRLRKVVEHSSQAYKNDIKTARDVYNNLSENYAVDREAQHAVLVRSMRQQATNDKRGVFYHLSAEYSGKEELFSDMNSTTTTKKLEDIADIYLNRSKKTYDGIVELFKTARQGGMNGVITGQNLEKLFGKQIDGDLNFKQEIFITMKKQIGYHPFAEVYRYKELKGHKTLGHLYDAAFEEFEEFNPTIFVHQVDDGQISVSLYDFTTEKTGEFTGDGVVNGNIARDFVSNNRATSLGISYMNSKVDIRKMLIGMIGANMMQKDQKVQVFDQGVIQFNRSDSHAFFVDPVTFRSTIKGLNQIPEFMKTVKDPSLNGIFTKPIRSAHQDYMKLLVSFYNSDRVGDWWKYGMSDVIKDPASMTMQERINVMSYRLKRVMAGRGEDSSFTSDEVYEIKILQEAIYDLKAIPWVDGQENSMRRTTAMERMLFDSNSIGNDYFQRMRDQVLQSSRKIVARIWEKKQSLYKKGGVFDIVREVYEKNHSPVVEERIRDITGAMWSPLFAKMKTDKGEAEIGAIYWTKDEKECTNDMERMLARQAREKNIDDKLIKVGREVTDLITEYYAKLIYTNRMNDYNQSPWVQDSNTTGHMYSMKDAMKDLIDMSKTSYFRGFIPVLPKGSTELASEGKVFNALKQKYEEVTDIYELFEENTNQGKQAGKTFMELNDMFFFQLGFRSHSRTELGSQQRTQHLLGIVPEYDKALKDVKWKLVDPKLNKRMSKDMEKILMYFMMGVERRAEYEENVLPMINGVKIFLSEKYGNSNVDTSGMIDHLNIFTDLGIRGEMKKIDAPGINVNAVLGTVQSIAAPMVMAGNVNIPTMSLVTNALYAMTEGIARHFVDDGIFNASDIVQGSALFFAEHSKVVQLAIDLQVISMSEYDMMHFRKRLKTKKYIASNYLVNYANWSADYYGRAVVMVAQMIHDGSWKAYTIDPTTGKLKYDPNKDDRFKDRKTNESQMALYNAYKKYLIADGYWGQTEDGELKSGYFSKMAARFKALSDKYVVGSYGTLEKALINRWAVGRAASMFYNWFFSRWTSAFQPEGFNDPLGHLVVEKDMQGKWLSKWERQYVGGYIATLSNYARDVFTIGKFKRWQDLNKGQKINFIKMMTLLTEAAAILLLYAAVVDDDKDKNKPISNWRIVRNFKYAVYSLFVVPTMIEWIRHPFAAVDILSGIFIDPMGNFRIRVPAKTQLDTIQEMFEENDSQQIDKSDS